MQALSVQKPLTAFHLKLIALVTMIVDHIGAALPISRPLGPLMRNIGRMAFPLYAFFVAEGCRHTRSRERYLLRLGLLALVSEIPFDLAFYNQRIDFLNATNIFYTLFLAVACIHIYETLRTQRRSLQLLGPASFAVFLCMAFWMYQYTQSAYSFLFLCLLYVTAMLGLCALLSRKTSEAEGKPDWLASLLALVPILFVLFSAELIDCDYSGFGVALVVMIYLARTRPLQIGMLGLGVLYKYGLEPLSRMIRWGDIFSSYEVLSFTFAMLSVVLVCLYNGERGKNVKWPFYWAYPAHIAILAVLRQIMFT